MADEHSVTAGERSAEGLAEAEYAQLESEFDALRALRDEMRVQLDLAAKEARGRFQAAEDRWESLEARMWELAGEGEPTGEAVRVTRNLFEEIREAYQQIVELTPPQKR
jgi:hypothetical protein